MPWKPPKNLFPKLTAEQEAKMREKAKRFGKWSRRKDIKLFRVLGQIKTKEITVGKTTLIKVNKHPYWGFFFPDATRLFFDVYHKVPEKEDRYNRLPRLMSPVDILFDGNNYFFVKNEEGQTAGACAVQIKSIKRQGKEEKVGLISRIVILPEFRAKKHATELMEGLFEILRREDVKTAYGYVSALDEPLPKAELRVMEKVGCRYEKYEKLFLRKKKYPLRYFWKFGKKEELPFYYVWKDL